MLYTVRENKDKDMNTWLTAASTKKDTPEASFERTLMDLGYDELEKLSNAVLSPNLDRLTEQFNLADKMGRDLAQTKGEHLVKSAGIAGTLMSAAKPLATKALGWAAKNPTAALGVGGAAAGALMAPSGHRLQGALTGGGIGYAAGRLGAGGMSGLAGKGLNTLSKVAFPNNLALGTAGALGGGIAGALHKSQAEKAGLEAGHHLRNTLIGAAGGATGALIGGTSSKAIGKTLTKLKPAAGKAVSAVESHPAKAYSTPKPSSFGGNYSPSDIKQMSRVRDMARAEDARKAAYHASQEASKSPNQSLATAVGRKVTPGSLDATMLKAASLGGVELLKFAWSNAQLEKNAGPPPIPMALSAASKVLKKPPPIPQSGLTSALKHLTPQGMRSLQAVPLH
jgi:hypothetical protein